MFSPPKRNTIVCLTALALSMLAGSDTWAQAQAGSAYEARMNAILAARERAGMAPAGATAPQATPQPAAPVQQVQYQEEMPQRVASMPRRGVARRAGRSMPAGYRTSRVAQLSETPMVQEMDPGVAGSVVEGGIMDEVIEPGMIVDEYVDGVEDACGCDSCGDVYSGVIGGCSTCPPMLPGDCWITSFGELLRKGEYFAGATAFRGPSFIDPANSSVVDDANFGFHLGANWGIPLCRLTCGLLSAQFGVRTVQTNLQGSAFSDENRSQVFGTFGLYRRVDYGLQLGVAADVLQDDWFTSANLVQVRSDISWVYGNGSILGFRSATGTSDDFSEENIGAATTRGIFTEVIDTYRFYFQKARVAGGTTELGVGWTSDSHTIFAFDADLPINPCTSLESGFTYFLSGDNETTRDRTFVDDDGWNLYVGVVWRPQGRKWYRSWDRPMFDVADNGTMFTRR